MPLGRNILSLTAAVRTCDLNGMNTGNGKLFNDYRHSMVRTVVFGSEYHLQLENSFDDIASN